MKIIVFEAGIISFISGLIGFVAGSIISVKAGPELANLQSSFDLDSSLLIPAIAISMLISIVAGLYPAIKAANLNPAQALRFI